jgi:hypothetical protein
VPATPTNLRIINRASAAITKRNVTQINTWTDFPPSLIRDLTALMSQISQIRKIWLPVHFLKEERPNNITRRMGARTHARSSSTIYSWTSAKPSSLSLIWNGTL